MKFFPETLNFKFTWGQGHVTTEKLNRLVSKLFLFREKSKFLQCFGVKERVI